VRSPHLPHNQWALTTDKVDAAPDGGFIHGGRSDRIAKVGGKRISLSAIDAALLVDGRVREARSVPMLQGRLAAVVVPSDSGWAAIREHGRKAFVESMRALLRGRVEPIAWPRRWRLVRALPLNAQGKTTAAALLGLFDEARGLPAAASQRLDGSEYGARIVPSADWIVFAGHFPGHPVLPGIAQVDWAIEYGKRAFDIEANFLRLDVVKFRRTISPGMELSLELQWRAAQSTLAFRWTSTEGEHSSGRAVFE
jgi:hypothetical protein